MDILGKQALKDKNSALQNINKELIGKTNAILAENQKMNSLLLSTMGGFNVVNGETNKGDLPLVYEQLFDYETLRLRSWQFILNNHIANLIVTKRANWLIGSGLLFNSKPSEKPFINFYGPEKGKKKHSEFITEVEFKYRNFEKTNEVDYSNENNLHEMARNIDYNASADGDVFLLMRSKNGLPNIQTISGQCVTDPFDLNELEKGHTVNEGVEKDKSGKIVAYHLLIDKTTSNQESQPITDVPEYGTERVTAYFKGTNFRKAWLYRASDLKKLGETRGMPVLSYVFESLQHVNDYIIANAKNAQLKAQMVIALEKDENSDGKKEFPTSSIGIAGMNEVETTTAGATEYEHTQSALAAEYKIAGNGIVLDLSRGVKAKMVNETAQSDQKEYLDSVLRTIFASSGTPYEVMISSYDSNYSASMGARSDYQHMLDVTTEIIPSAQLYKMHYNMFLYLQVISGKIECEPLKKAYNENDSITIQSIANSTFEGTKLKPIDPVKFINSLRAQLPASVRDKVGLNTIDNLVNSASGGDFESVTNQLANEITSLPEEFSEPEPVVKPNNE